MNEEQVCGIQRRRSRQEVEQVVAAFESSGLSRIEFCRERGLALSTLGRYRRQQQRQAWSGSNALLAVEVSGGVPGPVASGVALAVVPRGGRRIEVKCGFDAGALEQLVRVLERA